MIPGKIAQETDVYADTGRDAGMMQCTKSGRTERVYGTERMRSEGQTCFIDPGENGDGNEECGVICGG